MKIINNLIFVINIMGKSNMFKFKQKQSFLNTKTNKSYIILLCLIVLSCLLYFFIKKEGFKEGTEDEEEVFEEPVEGPIEGPVEGPVEDADEGSKPITLNCLDLKNKTMGELSGYTFDQMKECILEDYD